MLIKNCKKNIFLVAGRTGGPYFPIPKIISVLDEFNPIIVGVKNSFEERVCKTQKLDLIYLPEAKLNILSFSKSNLADKLLGFFDLILNLVKFKISFWTCIFELLRHQPKLIYTTGSFLAVPLFLAAKLLNFLSLTTIRLAVHQQDPMAGLSNRICVKKADLISCIFNHTKQNYHNFQDCFLIQNPILETSYEPKLIWENIELQTSIQTSKKPSILIFGGGSGARFINEWVWTNFVELTKNFRVVHLTGVLQIDIEKINKTEDYFSLDAVFADMPQLLSSVDFVLCRAGLGTISELEFLKKKAFLVPLPDSHQELNAELVKKRFVILNQKNSTSWLNSISDNHIFDDKIFDSTQDLQDIEYYKALKSLISN